MRVNTGRWITAGLVVLSALLVLAFAAWRQAAAWLVTPLPVPEEGVRFVIEQGATLSAVADRLAHQGVLPQPKLFVGLARARQVSGAIQAGEYDLRAGLTPAGLLDQLIAGRVVQHSFTIIEGWTFAQLRQALAAEPAIRHTLDDLSDDLLMQQIGHAGQHPEGRFFPDTYAFPRGTSDAALLKRAHRRMQSELAAAWADRAENLPLKSADEALTLASIVEKESRLASEREAIAGVFVRRLQRRMRLQADPTVIYGLGTAYDGDIRRADLRRDTPYNTYTRHGLPPTPIAMPGAASIAAAVRPLEGDAVYFVATGRGDGSHHFSATLKEHNAAVKRYLKALRSKR